MAIVVLEIIGLLCFLALPLIQWPKRKIINRKSSKKEIIRSKYAINRHGEIEEMINK